MSVTVFAFYLFAVSALTGGLFTVISRNPVHSVLWLILSFISSAGLFVLFTNDFGAMLLVVNAHRSCACTMHEVLPVQVCKRLSAHRPAQLKGGGFFFPWEVGTSALKTPSWLAKQTPGWLANQTPG